MGKTESNNNKYSLSIIAPVYNSCELISIFIEEVLSVITTLTSINNYEILLIDDGSVDNSWLKVYKACQENKTVKGIKLSRNFGQHSAITAGIENANGDYIIVMDSDLQHDPKYIPEILNEATSGYDIVYTATEKRKHSFFKNLTAYIFNLVFNALVGNQNLHSSKNIGSYSCISKKVAKEFLKFGDYSRHYLMVLRWLGFNSITIDIQHRKRLNGTSSYSIKKLFAHALNGIVSQSNKLLYTSIVAGFTIAFFSFIVGCILIYRHLVYTLQSGWTSTIVAIFFSLGIILISIGIVGIYLAKMFEQVKGRQIYIIEEKTNFIA